MFFFFLAGPSSKFFLLRLDRDSHAFTVSIGTGEILVLGFCPPRPNASAPMFYYTVSYYTVRQCVSTGFVTWPSDEFSRC